jgi:hypothetical protein
MTHTSRNHVGQGQVVEPAFGFDFISVDVCGGGGGGAGGVLVVIAGGEGVGGEVCSAVALQEVLGDCDGRMHVGGG